MKGGDLELPPGFRFHPTDEELVLYYLCRKCASMSLAVPIIAEIDLYKYDPWQLPGMALYGEKEWYFFSPRDRKYPNGSRPNRAAGSGYWKATGADKPIGTPNPVGIKKALVFYTGKAPRGLKTNWIMHEYRLANVDRSATARKKNNSRLDEWVLCRIYNKKGVIDDQPSSIIDSKKPQIAQPSSFDYSSEDHKPQIAPQHMQMPPPPPPVTTDVHYFDTSESVPRLQHTDSSCSDHVVSPEFTCEKEVQSEPRWRDWDMQMQLDNNPYDELSPLQDMFMYLQKPF